MLEQVNESLLQKKELDDLMESILKGDSPLETLIPFARAKITHSDLRGIAYRDTAVIIQFVHLLGPEYEQFLLGFVDFLRLPILFIGGNVKAFKHERRKVVLNGQYLSEETHLPVPPEVSQYVLGNESPHEMYDPTKCFARVRNYRDRIFSTFFPLQKYPTEFFKQVVGDDYRLKLNTVAPPNIVWNRHAVN